MRNYSLTHCRDCGHEEVSYANVKRCRVCHGPVEWSAPAGRRELMERIVARARLWAAHDEQLAVLIREWEAT